MRPRLVLPALLLLLPACIVEAPTSAQSGVSPARNQGKGAPVPVTSGAVLGELAQLLGATFLPASVSPGDSTQVVLVFRVLRPATEDWQVFVHVEDAEGRGERLNLDHPFRRPPTTWMPGETVQDEFAITLPPNWTSRQVHVYVGLWQPGTQSRIKVRNPQAVRTDGNDRILLVQLPVSG